MRATIIFLISFLTFFRAFSQDSLILKNQEKLFVKIENYNEYYCKFYQNNNLDSIKSIEIDKIKLKNNKITYFEKKISPKYITDAASYKQFIKNKDFISLNSYSLFIPSFILFINEQGTIPKNNISGLNNFIKYVTTNIKIKKLTIEVINDNSSKISEDLIKNLKKTILDLNPNYYNFINFSETKSINSEKQFGVNIGIDEFETVTFIEPKPIPFIPKIEIPRIDSFPKITNPFKGLFGRKDTNKVKENNFELNTLDSTFSKIFNNLAIYGSLGFNYINPMFSDSWTSKSGFFSLSHGINFGFGIEYIINEKSSFIFNLSKQTLKVKKTFYEENSSNENPLYTSKTKFTKVPINLGYRYYLNKFYISPMLGVLKINSKNSYSENHPDFGLKSNEKRFGIESSFFLGYRYNLPKTFLDFNFGYTRFFNFRGFQLVEQPFDTINLSLLIGYLKK